MIKVCGKTIAIPLKLIFRSMLEESVFPNDWKKSNVVQIHKRNSQNLIKNCQPISFLPIFSKVFDLYLVPCSIILYKTNFSLSVSLASFQVIHVLLNSCQLRMKLTNYKKL